jgi:hypothetical protein
MVSPTAAPFANPYRPGAGHMPPYLAGREQEHREFDRLLGQETILENLVLTGLRGVGKTVLLDTFKPRAVQLGWTWAGADLSESASIDEKSMAIRLLTDLAVVTTNVTIEVPAGPAPIGFSASPEAPNTRTIPLSFDVLCQVFESTPGLIADKLKATLILACRSLESHGRGRVVFAYDEAQNLADHASKDQYPLSTLLDVFQSLQRQGARFMLALTGLPTLFPKLVEARTFSERMFRVVTLGRLSDSESREAIIRPIEVADCPVSFDDSSVNTICTEAGGYPYFIQFICREVFDIAIQQIQTREEVRVPVDAIQRKLDTDFFAGRWAKATDRQRQLLWVVANLPTADEEFTIQELVAAGRRLLSKPFSPSHVNQMLVSLSEQGLVYKNRFGKYSLAVPLLGKFILRVYEPPTD